MYLKTMALGNKCTDLKVSGCCPISHVLVFREQSVIISHR